MVGLLATTLLVFVYMGKSLLCLHFWKFILLNHHTLFFLVSLMFAVPTNGLKGFSFFWRSERKVRLGRGLCSGASTVPYFLQQCWHCLKAVKEDHRGHSELGFISKLRVLMRPLKRLHPYRPHSLSWEKWSQKEVDKPEVSSIKMVQETRPHSEKKVQILW